MEVFVNIMLVHNQKNLFSFSALDSVCLQKFRQIVYKFGFLVLLVYFGPLNSIVTTFGKKSRKFLKNTYSWILFIFNQETIWVIRKVSKLRIS